MTLTNDTHIRRRNVGVPGGVPALETSREERTVYETFDNMEEAVKLIKSLLGFTAGFFDIQAVVNDLSFTDGRITYIDLDDPRMEKILERHFIG